MTQDHAPSQKFYRLCKGFRNIESDQDSSKDITVIIIIIIQFFIIYVSSQQLQGQLQTQHSVITDDGLQREYRRKILIKQRSKPANK
jgi:hypothetical protein